ncbi:efflux RND transporter periplasmic adaptor subunit [Desulfobacterota bacterium AH_259_B03_O07]|nr:efflux RND transporter periplasmic adaptor subunit [Desulfobacterota bacterium AH_259_B03_O07]
MNRRKIIVITILAIALIVVVFFTNKIFRSSSYSYAFNTATIDRGDIISYISAAGTINPMIMVEVAAQVSGAVNEIYVDFNSIVIEGEVLARIDPTHYEFQVKQAKATLKKAKVDADKKKKIFELYRELNKDPDRISKYELDNSRLDYITTMEQLKITKTELGIAEANFNSTTIRSPIDGVIISRDVSVGEYVNSSKGDPIFVIANDLTNMKVDVHVSEADIGMVKDDQEAAFTVDAYPDQKFKGTVWQVRNEPITTNNVVTYDVVVLINNEDHKLKPGMTAEVNILVANRKDVLRVPTAALRFIPPDSDAFEQNPDNLTDGAVVWTISKNGRFKALSIEPGISDAIYTEISDGEMKEGQEVITEAVQKGSTNSEHFGPLVLPKPRRF